MTGFALLIATSALTTALNSTAPEPSYGPQAAKPPVEPIPASRQIAAFKTPQPGDIRPASYDRNRHDEPERNFTCVDRKCKVTTPVYNTGTPTTRERGRLTQD